MATDRARPLSTALSSGILPIALLVAGCAMRIAYHKWRESLFLVAALPGQLAVYMLTARVVARARPAVPQLDVFPPMRSFPSGHVAAAVAVYGGIAVVLAIPSAGQRGSYES